MLRPSTVPTLGPVARGAVRLSGEGRALADGDLTYLLYMRIP